MSLELATCAGGPEPIEEDGHLLSALDERPAGDATVHDVGPGARRVVSGPASQCKSSEERTGAARTGRGWVEESD